MNKQQEYWNNPKDKPNKPETYIKPELNKRSHFLFKLIKGRVHRKNSILEVGCNAGRNLNYLNEKGYLNLNGIEINAQAVELMRKVYPKLYEKAKISISSLEGSLPFLKDNSFNVVVSMAVFMHLPYESNFIFKNIARITKDIIITIEDERPEILGNRHFPRNYLNIFGSMGFREIESGKCPLEDLKNYTWMIFKKK